MKCPKRGQTARSWLHGRWVYYSNALNVCRLCGHQYEVTTFLGNDRRSFKCPCCR